MSALGVWGVSRSLISLCVCVACPGGRFLLATISISDLLLNAVALESAPRGLSHAAQLLTLLRTPDSHRITRSSMYADPPRPPRMGSMRDHVYPCGELHRFVLNLDELIFEAVTICPCMHACSHARLTSATLHCWA